MTFIDRPNIGPGTYDTEKTEQKIELVPNLQSKQLRDDKQFGQAPRFQQDLLAKDADEPGPGSYNQLNYWHKRTFNLQVLNAQA